jgi:hypothetical protein
VADWEQPGERVLEFCRRNPHTPVIRQCHFVGFLQIEGGWVEMLDEVEAPGLDVERAGVVLDDGETVRGIAFVVRQDGKRHLYAFDESGDSGLLPIGPRWQGSETWRLIVESCERALATMPANTRPGTIDPRTAYAVFGRHGNVPPIDSWSVYTTVSGTTASPPFDGRVEFWDHVGVRDTGVSFEHVAVAFDAIGHVEAVLTAETGPLQGGRCALILYTGGHRKELKIDDRYLDLGEFSLAAAGVLRPLLQDRSDRRHIEVPPPPATTRDRADA